MCKRDVRAIRTAISSSGAPKSRRPSDTSSRAPLSRCLTVKIIHADSDASLYRGKFRERQVPGGGGPTKNSITRNGELVNIYLPLKLGAQRRSRTGGGLSPR